MKIENKADCKNVFIRQDEFKVDVETYGKVLYLVVFRVKITSNMDTFLNQKRNISIGLPTSKTLRMGQLNHWYSYIEFQVISLHPFFPGPRPLVIIHSVVRTQKCPKNCHFLTPDTYTYMCVSGVRKYIFFGRFFARAKWMIHKIIDFIAGKTKCVSLYFTGIEHGRQRPDYVP